MREEVQGEMRRGDEANGGGIDSIVCFACLGWASVNDMLLIFVVWRGMPILFSILGVVLG
jgi:hypothetical protein